MIVGKVYKKPVPIQLRKHHKWLGKQTFFCKGKIFAGPKPLYFVMTFTILNMIGVISFTTYFVDLYTLGFFYLFWLHALFLFLTDIFMVITAITDPGTIPMRKFLQITAERPVDNLKEFLSCQPHWLVLHQGRLQKLKVCFACQIYRPIRAVHCDDCGTCILGLDHHCPWVNNCIGIRNYKYFLIFVNSLCMLIISTIFGGLLNLYYQSELIGKEPMEQRLVWRYTIREKPTSLIIPFIALAAGLFPVFLSSYHHFLLCANLTTNEQCKRSHMIFKSRFRSSYCVYLFNIFKVRRPLWNPSERLISLELDSYRLKESIASARSLMKKDSDASGVPEDS